MDRISWLSNAPSFGQAVASIGPTGRITGGVAYNLQACKALQEKHTVDVPSDFHRYASESVFHYSRRIAHIQVEADTLIMDPMVISFHHQQTKARSIGMVHHIDYIRKHSSLKHWLYLSRLERKLVKLDRIVVVSKYWQDYLTRRGAKDVKVIYNSFPVEEYQKLEVNNFRELHGISSDKPLIFLGIASRDKGFDRALEILGSSEYQLLGTGQWNGKAPGNLKVLNLERADYLAMLQAVDVTVSLPLIPEGWSRVAHESLLSGTPVIGLRSGGMTELLENAGQNVITSEKDLLPQLKHVLKERDKYSTLGMHYSQGFSMEYFRKAWLDVCEF